MSKVPPNPKQPGRILEEHLHDGFVVDGEPPLPPDERRRRVVRLCCSFMRNLACHRAGLHAGVKSNLLNPNHPKGGFWLDAHGNFFDTCVLDWCKLFADRKGKHHWRRVVENPDRFEADLYTTLGVTADAFTTLITKIKDYRDRFVAHLDEDRMMLLPELEVARTAIVFLHQRLAQMIASLEEWPDLPASAEELAFVYQRASQQAETVYAEAVRAARRL